MRNRLYVSIIAMFVLLFSAASCQNGKKEPVAFPMVEPSGVEIANDTLLKQYMARHFWEAYLDPSRKAVSDTAMIAGVKKSDVIMAMAQYVANLRLCTYDQVIESNGILADHLIDYVKKTGDDLIAPYFMKKLQRIFFDADSQYRNDEIALSLYSRMYDSGVLDSLSASDVKFVIDRICLNRINRPVADFSYLTNSGKEARLYDLQKEGKYTILSFGNPDCSACTRALDMIERTSLDEAIKSGRVNMVLLYSGEEIEKWKEYLKDRPKEWIMGFDYMNVLNDLYDLKAVPTFYLLDKDMNLVVKDGVITYVGSYLYSKGLLKEPR